MPDFKKKKQTGAAVKIKSVGPEVAELGSTLTVQLDEIVKKRVEASTKVMENQLRQVREQLSAVKIKRKNEVETLTTAKQTAEAKLNQANQRLVKIGEERDALIKRLKSKNAPE